MGFGGISIWQLLIVLAIVALIFGTKRLRGIGSDLGSAIKGFRSSIKDDDAPQDSESKTESTTGHITEQPKSGTEDAKSKQQTTEKDKV